MAAPEAVVAGCTGYPAVKLRECDSSLSPQDVCTVGLIKFPPAVAKFVVEKGFVPQGAPTVSFVPLSESEKAAVEFVANYMLGRGDEGIASKKLNATLWYGAVDSPRSLVGAAPFAIANKGQQGFLQPKVSIGKDCGSFVVQSLTGPTDNKEHYAAIVFNCKNEEKSRQALIAVALDNGQPIRVSGDAITVVCVGPQANEQ